MSIFIGFLYVVEVLVCLLLALVVMLQKPKEGGLGGAIGGGMLEASLGADASVRDRSLYGRLGGGGNGPGAIDEERLNRV